MFVQVAVPGPFLTPLSYSYNGDGLNSPVVGGRVSVPFRNKPVISIVMALVDHVDCELKKIKPITAVIDDTAIFSTAELALLNWASFYYHEPIGNVIQTALPKRLRQGEAVSVVGLPAWELTALGQADKTAVSPLVSARAKQQQAIMAVLCQDQSTFSADDLNAQLSHWRTPMKRLVELGLVVEKERLCLSKTPKTTWPGHKLNAEQQIIVDAVSKVIDAGAGFKTFLVDGITGSGKTEVYLGAIEKVLAQGKQVLVLVPEIGLTPQTVQRFEAYLQVPVAIMHSALSDKERHCAWSLIKNNKISVLLGTRSALFTPFANLGLCIMDEEHDLSYKQQDGFRYSARDCLIRRAHLENIPVMLGSATPSFETLHNAKTGRYASHVLRQRAAGAVLPDMRLLDMRKQPSDEGIAPELRAKIESHLAADGQVLLFLNRRGYAPLLMCHSCGWQATCESCDANMTYHHQFNELRCHHCGHQTPSPTHCPDCHADDFVKTGLGTERLASLVQGWFPDESVLRIDRDTTRLKGQINELTQQAKMGKDRILLGTQMLAKGHHFPNVTLVGILDIDAGLFSADFRAAERMAQLIIQVAGRSGRAEKKGEVIIQTHQPEHPLLTTLINEGYAEFAESALQERKQASLPPYQFQILIRAEANDAEAGWYFLNEIKGWLDGLKPNLVSGFMAKEARKQGQSQKVMPLQLSALGPVSAPMFRRQGRYRYQLLLQSTHRGVLHQWLGQVESSLYSSALGKKTRWNIDVDPQEMA